MTHPVLGIDHCYLMVRDLNRSLDQFRCLGFTVSPRGLHSTSKGTANHTIMLAADDYFELLGIVAETEDNAPRRALLEHDGEGLYAIACRIGDAHAAKTQLAAMGIATNAVSSFERALPLSDGKEAVAAFSVLQFDNKEVPRGIAFMCQHHTRDMVWRPELMHHANGAQALAGIIAADADPKAAAERYARLFAGGVVARLDDGWQLNTGSVPITFATAEALAARYAGLNISLTPKNAFAVLQIAVDNLDRTTEILRENGVHSRGTANGIAVDPSVASGAVVEFISRRMV